MKIVTREIEKLGPSGTFFALLDQSSMKFTLNVGFSFTETIKSLCLVRPI